MFWVQTQAMVTLTRFTSLLQMMQIVQMAQMAVGRAHFFSGVEALINLTHFFDL
jgi:hypothetical protein